MKRKAILVLATALAVGSLAAQSTAPAATPPLAQQSATITKVEGSLALVNGMIAIKAKDKTYYAQGLQHLLGFVDGLKEGASVKVEGYVNTLPMAPEYSVIRLTKLTFNGRDFDLSQVSGFGRGMGDGRGRDMMGAYGPQGGNGQMNGRGSGPGMMGGRR